MNDNQYKIVVKIFYLLMLSGKNSQSIFSPATMFRASINSAANPTGSQFGSGFITTLGLSSSSAPPGKGFRETENNYGMGM
jgi:hypothetical protein